MTPQPVKTVRESIADGRASRLRSFSLSKGYDSYFLSTYQSGEGAGSGTSTKTGRNFGQIEGLDGGSDGT